MRSGSFLIEKDKPAPKKSRMSMKAFLGLGGKEERPSSLPRNWPNPTAADLEERPKRCIKIGSEQEFYFRNNFVKTSKYEIFNFVPKFLFEEFNPKSKIANCYFLAIAALQVIPQITNTGGYPTTLIPLTFVVVVDGIFAILEDIARHRADAEANSSMTTLFDPVTQEFIEVTWKELNVGNIVRVDTRCTIPADMVILSVAEKTDPPQGICYVETKSLDGETNLKMRNALPNTMSVVSFLLFFKFITIIKFN